MEIFSVILTLTLSIFIIFILNWFFTPSKNEGADQLKPSSTTSSTPTSSSSSSSSSSSTSTSTSSTPSSLPTFKYHKTYIPFFPDERDPSPDEEESESERSERESKLDKDLEKKRKEIHAQPDREQKQLVVDCTHPRSLTLTHHKNMNALSPHHLKGDSSVDCVFNAIHARHPGLNLPYVTTNHFDIDSIVSVFAAMASPPVPPEGSSQKEEEEYSRSFPLRHEELLKQVSKIGDFREFDPSNPVAVEACKICCWLNTVEKREFYKPFDGDERLGSPMKFDYFLPLFPKVIEDVAKFEQDWKDEFEIVMSGIQSINERGSVQRFPELGFVVVCSPEPVHYYSLFSFTDGYDVLLAIYGKDRYELELKYTSYVDIMSRPILPRVEPSKLIEKLNDLESPTEPDLFWNGSRIVDSGPIIRLDRKGIKLNKAERYGHPYERPIYSSSIPQAEVIHLVKTYLEHAYQGVEKKSPWTWPEIHKFNREIDWEAWSPKPL